MAIDLLKNKFSLHNKIVIWTSLVVGSILFGLSAVSLILIRNKLESNMDQRLDLESDEISITLDLIDDNLKIVHEFEWNEPQHKFDVNPIYIIVLDKNQKVKFKSQNYLTQMSPVRYLTFDKDRLSFKTIPIHEKKIKFVTKPLYFDDNHHGWVIVGMPFDKIFELLSLIRNVYLIIVPIALIIAFFGSSFIAKKALAPVLYISETVRHIHATNLDKKLKSLDTEDEISHLVETINKLLDRLKNSFNTIRQFTANASHELKIPLSIIQANLEQYEKNIQDNLNEQYLNRTKIELARMVRLIDDLSTLAKTDTKQITLKKETVWLNDLIHDGIERYRTQIDEKNIKISTNDLSSISINADIYWMEALVSNLLDNAIKFSDDNSNISIEIIENLISNNIQFNFVDEGIGIQGDEIKNITRRFYRIENEKKVSGSGLGLAIVDWVIKSHDGSMSFSNNSNGGLTVTVDLPIV
jgi:signal transduction histidine kinase